MKIGETPPVPFVGPAPDSSPMMDLAARRLAKTIKMARDGERKIALFGDFDVDGTTASAILYLFCKLSGVVDVRPYVSRRTDGYGFTSKSVDRLLGAISQGGDHSTTSVIAMDLGVSSGLEVGRMLAAGVSVMVIDHHVPKPGAMAEWDALGETYGEDVSVYDPLLYDGVDDRYFSCLSAAGLTFKLCMLILENDYEGLATAILSLDKVQITAGYKPVPVDAVINTMAKCCAIAQAADCMPFAKDGRVTAAWWLAKEYENHGPLLAGLSLLYEKTHTASRISWVVGPILNAAGRLEDAFAAFDLLVETDEAQAREKLKAMETVRERVQGMTRTAAVNLEQDLLTSRGVAVLVGDPAKIRSGVLGIAAARATETLQAPALYLCPEDDGKNGIIFKGSMRRGETDFSCEEWILNLRQDGIAVTGGGHPAAAGVTIAESRLEDLIKNAESCVYNLETPPVFRVTVGGARAYLDALLPALPFGRGHESANLAVVGVLASVRPLLTARDGSPKIWAYSLGVIDPESSENIDIKVMASEVDGEMRDLLDRLAGEKTINAPVEILAVVHDGYKRESRFPRAEFRAKAVPRNAGSLEPKGEPSLEEAPRGGNGDPDKVVSVRFLTKTQFADIFSRGPASQVQPSGDLPGGVGKGLEGLEEALAGDRRLIIHVDWNESLHRRVFSLKRPPKWELEQALGEHKMKALSDSHGGRWHDKLRCYLIPAGALETIIEGGGLETDDWRFVLTPAAKAHYRSLQDEASTISNQKQDTRPFPIPRLRPGHSPLGFQYADVRLYLERPLAICHNDMGTGKTFEAAMWGILRYHGAHIDQDRNILLPEEVPGEGVLKRPPILVVTLKGVMGQFADELEKFLDVRAARLATGEVRAFLGRGAKGLSDEDDSENGKKLKPVGTVDREVAGAFYAAHIAGREFVVTTYDCVGRHPWLVKSFHWSGVILDEAHEVKTVDTNKTQALLGASIDGSPLGGAPLLVLSGTLTKNRPADWFVWVRLSGADGGIYSGGPVSSAKVRFDMRFDGLTFEKVKGRGGREFTKTVRSSPANGDELKRLMFPFVVRRLKTELADFPTIRVRVERSPSSGLYMDVLSSIEGLSQLRDSSRQILEKYGLLTADGALSEENVEADKGETADQKDAEDGVGVVEASSLAGKLALISSLDKGRNIMATLRQLKWVDEAGRPDEPFVIIGMHRSAVLEISSQLGGAGIDHFLMMQADSAEKRRAKAQAFAAGEKQAFVTTYGVGGTGLNLTRARRILLAGLPYTETLLAQARDRVHRIGQKRDVEAVILINSATIDEAIWWLVTQKGRANFATAGVDRVKKGELPPWAKGSIADQAKESQEGGRQGGAGGRFQRTRDFTRPASTGPANGDLAARLNRSGGGGFRKN